MADSNETLAVKIDAIKELLVDHIHEGRKDRQEDKAEIASIYKRINKHEKWINRAYGAMTIIVAISGGLYTYLSYFVQNEIDNSTNTIQHEIITSREMSDKLDDFCNNCK